MNMLNRLKSIYYDSIQVLEFEQKIPNSQIVANLRCGKWYCNDPKVKTCYFKSTDGHNDQWDFNSRRLNINVLELILSSIPVIIVDATANSRKVYPDALSKTIPIWITVFNTYLKKISNLDIDTPINLPRTITTTEKNNLVAHIDNKLEPWLVELENTLDNNTIIKIKDMIKLDGFRPIIPIFVSSIDNFDITYYNSIQSYGLPVICFSVGNHDKVYIENQEDRNFKYILGAGDDEEMWSIKISAEQFWKNYKTILNCSDDNEIKDVIVSITNTKLISLSLLDNTIELFNRPNDNINVVSMKIYTDNANYYKNIGEYNMLKYNIQYIIGNLLKTLYQLKRYTIKKIEIYCNNFKISLALIVSIIVHFKNNIIKTPLILDNIDIISKQYIRKIISYIHQISGDVQLSRRCCQNLNQYFIDIPLSNS